MKIIIEHHHYLHYDPPMLRKVLEEVLETKQITQALGGKLMSAKDELKDLISQVNDNTNQMAASLEEEVDATTKIGTVLQDLKDKLDAAGKDGLSAADVAELKTSVGDALLAQQSVEDKQKTIVDSLKALGADPANPVPPVDL